MLDLWTPEALESILDYDMLGRSYASGAAEPDARRDEAGDDFLLLVILGEINPMLWLIRCWTQHAVITLPSGDTALVEMFQQRQHIFARRI